MTANAHDAAKAANNLLGFSGDDREVLLEVMADYFTSPDRDRDSESDEDNDTSDGEAKLKGTTNNNY